MICWVVVACHQNLFEIGANENNPGWFICILKIVHFKFFSGGFYKY